MRNNLNTILLLVALFAIIQASEMLAQQAPLPPRLTSAKTAVVINDRTWPKAYGKFYGRLRKWNRFHLVEDEEQADIAIILSNQPGKSHSYQIRIVDLSNEDLLWSDYGGPAKALLSNSPIKLVKRLRRRFVGVPYTTPVAVSIAKDLKWQEATFYKITTKDGDNYAFESRAGGSYESSSLGIYSSRESGVIRSGTTTYTYYWFKTEKIIYILFIRNRGPNLTLHGKTKIAPEGRKAYILDDDGRQRRYSIVQKIAIQQEKDE